MGTGRRVDLEDVQATTVVGELDADIIAIHGTGPVGDPIGVEFAAKGTDGGRVLLMRRNADDLATLADRRSGNSRS